MRLLPIKQVEHQLLKAIKQQQLGYWQLATFKKDRTVALTITTADFTITEKGYLQTVWQTNEMAVCRKQLKAAFKREFPRSHQVYFQAKDISK